MSVLLNCCFIVKCIESVFHVNDEPEGKFLYTETDNKSCFVLYLYCM